MAAHRQFHDRSVRLDPRPWTEACLRIGLAKAAQETTFVRRTPSRFEATGSPKGLTSRARIIVISQFFGPDQSAVGQFLADFADPKFQPSLMNIQEVKVEMYATTAIVTGTYHTKGTYGTKPYEHFGRFTDTWVFQDGKWLCVASHTSLLKK